MDMEVMERALAGFGERLRAVRDDQWSGPTPCVDWDVRALVNHVVGELLWIPPLLEGLTIDDVGDRFDGDVLGADPVATGAAASAAALAKAAQPGVHEDIVHLSFGDFSGSEYLGQVSSDVLIHTWDLARAIGHDEQLDPVVVAWVTEFLAPQIELWRSAGAFGLAVDNGPDPSPQDHLLGETGRPTGTS